MEVACLLPSWNQTCFAGKSSMDTDTFSHQKPLTDRNLPTMFDCRMVFLGETAWPKLSNDAAQRPDPRSTYAKLQRLPMSAMSTSWHGNSWESRAKGQSSGRKANPESLLEPSAVAGDCTLNYPPFVKPFFIEPPNHIKTWCVTVKPPKPGRIRIPVQLTQVSP